MLRIECTQKEGVVYPLLADQKYSVGRRLGEITLPDDQSVSRCHAELEVQHPAGNITEPDLVPILSLTDSGSKFGTFAPEMSIREKLPISPRESISLPIGEKLRFGLQWNEFRVSYTPFVVTTSSMKPTADFKARIVKLGGHLINEWDSNVTHVVMEGVTLTVKVVCALLAAKPIVTPAYVADLLDSFITKKAQPNPTSFLPPVKEKEIANLRESTFYPDSSRTTLFAGKTFLFCTAKHLKKMSSAIIAGGGNPELMTKDTGANVASSEYIIMGQPSEIAIGEKDPSTKSLLDVYRRSGKRFVGDSEIGLAAVHKSLDKFCNPKFNIGHAVLPSIPTQSQSSSISNVTIVPATQDILQSQRASEGNDTTRKVVNETVLKNEAETIIDDDDDDIVFIPSGGAGAKKRTLEPPTNSAKKRTAAESLSGPNSKRLKEVPKPTRSPMSLSRSTRSQTKVSNPARALTSLFGLSDSEDDQEEEGTPIVSETQPRDDLNITPSNGPRVVLDSQTEDTTTQTQPLVSVVDVRNLQSLRETQATSTSANSSVRVDEVETADPDDVMRIPDSPPPASPEIEETVEAEENGRARRNPGTDFVGTITTSIMNAKTIVLTPKSPPKKAAAEEPSTSRADSTRKRRRVQEDETEKTLLDKTKKMNLTDLKEMVKEDDIGAGVVSCIKQPLVNKNLHESLIVPSRGACKGKNFKIFRKVLPKFVTASRNASSGQENLSGRSVTSALNASIESIRNSKPVKLAVKDYDPGHSKYYGNADSRPAPVTEAPLRGEETDAPPEFEELDDMFNFNQPAPAPTRRNARRKNEEPQPTTSRSTRNKQSVAAASSSTQDTIPAASGKKRSSPRKKGGSRSEAALMPPPPAPAFVPMEEDDEGEEDDMWTFNR